MATVQRTMYAAKAMNFATLFQSLLGPARLMTAEGEFRPELSTPEGESTGGGKQSVQHIKLIPLLEGGTTLVMGSVDANAKTAEIRTYDGFLQMVRRRFKAGGGPVPEEESYEALVKKVSGLLTSQGLQVTMKDAEAEAPAPSRARTASRPRASSRPSPDSAEPDDVVTVQNGNAKKFLITIISGAIALAVGLALLLR